MVENISFGIALGVFIALLVNLVQYWIITGPREGCSIWESGRESGRREMQGLKDREIAKLIRATEEEAKPPTITEKE